MPFVSYTYIKTILYPVVYTRNMIICEQTRKNRYDITHIYIKHFFLFQLKHEKKKPNEKQIILILT